MTAADHANTPDRLALELENNRLMPDDRGFNPAEYAPADHANTVREGIVSLLRGSTNPARDWKDIKDALDALEAQAKRADMLYRINQKQIDLVRAAEAERDRLLDDLRLSREAHWKTVADRDRLKEWAEDQITAIGTRLTKMEADRDRLADALRQIGELTPYVDASSQSSVVKAPAIARGALAQTENTT